MSGICDTCKRKECYMQHDGDDSCPLYLKGKPSRYKRLFGTPDRAALTIMEYGKTINTCAQCLLCHDPIGVTCGINGECPWVDKESCYDAILEWLRGEGE